MIADKLVVATRKPRRIPRHYAGCKPKTNRPPLDPSRIYSLREGALAFGVSISTLVRARNSGNLVGLKVGAKIVFTGEALLAWLNSGGKTK